MRQFYRGRPRCEAADCSHRLSTARAASARPGRPATAVWGSPLPAPMLSMRTLSTSEHPLCLSNTMLDTQVGNLAAFMVDLNSADPTAMSSQKSLHWLASALISGEQRRTTVNVQISMVYL